MTQIASSFHSLLVVVIALSVIIPTGAVATAPPQPLERSSELSLDKTPTEQPVSIVILFENFSARQTADLDEETTITGGKEIDFAPVIFAETPASNIPTLRARTKIEHVVANSQISVSPSPDAAIEPHIKTAQTTQTLPWGVERIGARKAASQVSHTAQQNVTVAVLDTGIAYQHDDLDENVVWGANLTADLYQTGLSTSADNAGHGTAVAGIIAAENNEQGTVGVAPYSELYSIKVLDQDQSGKISWVIRGIDAALKGPDGTIGTTDDADVLTMSFGTKSSTAEFASVIAWASDNAVLVSSAGNSGDGDPTTNEVAYPAKYPGSIAVAATTKSDEVASFSAEGGEIELSAPGVDILTLSVGGETTVFAGTSAAAPHTAGTAALLLASRADEEPENQSMSAVRQRLQETALDIATTGKDNESGYGLVQADEALLADSGSELPQIRDVNRTLSAKTGVPGETIAVTVQSRISNRSAATIQESFEPAFQETNLNAVKVNSSPVDTIFSATTKDEVAVTTEQLPAGGRLAVKYEVTIPENATSGEMFAINGTITSEESTVVIPEQNITVETGSSLEGIAGYYDANNNGVINLAELSDAAIDYAQNELTLAKLGAVAVAYAKSS